MILNDAGGSFVLAGWWDSSLTLWNLAEPSQAPLYRKKPHLAAIVDVDARPELRLMASVDKNRRCILSLLDSGAFVREFMVDATEPLQWVMLFSAGYVAVLAEEGEGRAVIQIYGINGAKISEMKLGNAVVVE